MRSRTKELQENDIKTKEVKKNELKKNRERGKVRWRNMNFFAQKKGGLKKREGQKMVKNKKRPRKKGEKEKGKGQRQKKEKGGGGKEEHNKTEILKTTEIPKMEGGERRR